MPKTRFDAIARRATNKAERDAFIVRKAFAQHGVFKQKEMCEMSGIDPASMSKGLKHGFSPKQIFKLHAAVRFTEKDLEELVCAK